VYGLDTISVGAAVAFAIECFDKGLLTLDDTGMELRFGDGECVVALTRMIARREGVGAWLADGVVRAAEHIGNGADEFAVHAGGQELPAHDPRFYPSLSLTYRLDATPGRHSRGGSSWIAGIGFMESPADKYQAAGIGESHKRASAMCHVMASCGNCLFAYTSHPSGYIPEFLTALTGREHDFESCVRIGERIENMRHLFNLREGVNPLKIAFNQRALGKPPLEKGATAGITVDDEAMIDDFCAAMEWDRETAMPSQGKLDELGLSRLVAKHGGVSL
jgi:aldehyde:ferredoxin oxidoreductase